MVTFMVLYHVHRFIMDNRRSINNLICSIYYAIFRTGLLDMIIIEFFLAEQKTSGQEGDVVHVQPAAGGRQRELGGLKHLPQTPVKTQQAVVPWL